MKKSAGNASITLSDDPDLYFHTQVADLISDQEQHTTGIREEFAGEMLKAIFTGALHVYNHRDGARKVYEPSWTGPFCVRPQDVNDWLARKTRYQFRWSSVAHQGPDLPKSMTDARQERAPGTSSTSGVARHNTKGSRRRNLQPVIEVAQGLCKDPWDVAEVWAQLLILAGKKYGQLIGATEDGLQYLNEGDVAIFRRDSLQKRLKRAWEKLPIPPVNHR